MSKRYRPRDMVKRDWSMKDARKKRPKQMQVKLCTSHARSVWKDSTQGVELDRHTVDKHIFICGECLRTFKTKAERDAHMKTDHKEVPTQMTKQEKLPIEEYRKRESREEKDRRATETSEKTWTEYAAKKSKQEAEESRQTRRRPTATQTKEQAERAEGDDKDEDEDYVPSEEPSSEDPTYEPTRRELRRADKEGDQ